MKPVLAATLATAAVLAASAAAEAAPGQVRSALREARAPAGQLEQGSARQSFGVTFRRFRQSVDGVPVLGSELVVTDAPGRRGDLVVDRTRRVGEPRAALLSRRKALRVARRGGRIRALRVPPRAALAILPTGHGPALVWRVLMASARPVASLEVLVDARSGRLVRTRDLLQYATGSAQLFDPNPVVANGGTAGLSDADDADSDLLTGLRAPRALPRLDASTCLRGSYVEAVLPPGDPDADTPAGDVCSPTLDFTAVTRSNNRFEALMAYFHIDRAQTYLQALGFPNVLNRPVRANVDAQIPGPLTEDGQDNSFFDLLTGELTFGTGWADDAEDAETILHEYGHAIQEDQVPGFPAGSDAGAIGEGFGDYFASAMSAVFAPRAGFEGCFDEWDAFASGLGDCLRRVDLGVAARRSVAGLRTGRRRALPGRGLVRRPVVDPRRAGGHGGRQARDPVAVQPDPDGELRPGGARAPGRGLRALPGRSPDAAEDGAGRPQARGRRAPGRHPGGRDAARAAGAGERAAGGGLRRPRRVRAEAHRAAARWRSGWAPDGRTTTSVCCRPAPPA